MDFGLIVFTVLCAIYACYHFFPTFSALVIGVGISCAACYVHPGLGLVCFYLIVVAIQVFAEHKAREEQIKYEEEMAEEERRYEILQEKQSNQRREHERLQHAVAYQEIERITKKTKKKRRYQQKLRELEKRISESQKETEEEIAEREKAYESGVRHLVWVEIEPLEKRLDELQSLACRVKTMIEETDEARVKRQRKKEEDEYDWSDYGEYDDEWWKD